MSLSRDVLDGFWKLGDAKDQVRISSASRIVQHVMNLSSEAETTFPYILSRLVRGLASNRQSARQGFFVALVEVLRQCPRSGEEIFALVQNIVKEHFSRKGSKSEEGDYLVGQLLCHGALLRCGRLKGSVCAQVVRHILEVIKKRSYLLIPAYSILVDFLEKSNGEDVSTDIWPVLTEFHDWKTSESLSLESLWLLLTIQRVHPKVLNKKFMLESFGRKKLVTKELCDTVAKTRDETSIPIHMMKKHPAHAILVRSLADEGLLSHFWHQNIDPDLPLASSYKVMAAFALLSCIVDTVDDAQVVGFLTPNVVQAALKYLSRLESLPVDDQLIFGVLAKISAVAKEHEKFQIPIVKALMAGPAGKITFDMETGGNVIQQLLVNANKECVAFVGKLYRQAILGTEETDGEQRTAQERVFACHQLAKLASHPQMKEDPQWIVETLNFLLASTLFDIKTNIAPLNAIPKAFSHNTRMAVKEVFFRALEFKSKDADEMCQLVGSVVQFADNLMTEASPVYPLDTRAESAWKDTLANIKGMGRKKKQRKLDQVFKLLFMHLGLQLLHDATTICDVLEDLKQCHIRALAEVKKQSKKQKKKDSPDEPLWVEVIVDVLVSLQSQNKHALRQLAKVIFSKVCPQLSDEGLRMILEVIRPKKRATSDHNGNDAQEYDDDDWEDMEENSEENQNENMDAGSKQAGEAEDDGDDDDDDDEEEEEEEEEDDEDEDEDGDGDGDGDDGDEDENEDTEEDVDTLRDKLKSALGDYVDSDQESIDMDEISEEDMRKMDEALAEVFRTLSKSKRSGGETRKDKKDAIAMVHFKVRVLDLIDVYLNHQPLATHVLMIMDTVMHALEESSKKKNEKPLEMRLRSTLKKVTNLKKPQQFRIPEETRAVTGDIFVESLQSMVDLATSGSSLMPLLNNPIPLFSQCCTLIMKMASSLNDGGETLRRINGIYDVAVDEFFQNTICMLPINFFSLPMQGKWSHGWSLADKMIKHGFDPKIRQFRRVQAMTLLSTLFHNMNIDTETTNDLRNEAAKKLEKLVLQELKGGNVTKPRFVCEILDLLHGMHLANAPVAWEDMGKALDTFRVQVIPHVGRFADVKKAFNHVASRLRISVVQGRQKGKRNDKAPGQSDGVPGTKKLRL